MGRVVVVVVVVGERNQLVHPSLNMAAGLLSPFVLSYYTCTAYGNNRRIKYVMSSWTIKFVPVNFYAKFALI
jgi:hypothetical protein